MAAQFVRRWDSTYTIATFPLVSALDHKADELIVIDWITVTLNSVTGGNASFYLADPADTGSTALATFMYKVTVPLAAGDSDTVHIPFPGGLPLKKVQKIGGTELEENTLAGEPVAGNNVTCTLGDAATTGQCWIGFHLERETNRR